MQDRESSASRLTYADVHMVLALLQGWGEGAVSLRHAGLAVDAVLGPSEVSAAAPTAVRSPAVGIFRPQSSPGMLLKHGEPMAFIEAFDRSTPVLSPVNGKLLRLSIPAHSFVEYDEEIAVIGPREIGTVEEGVDAG